MTDEGHQGVRLNVRGAHPQVLGDAQPWVARVVRPRAQGMSGLLGGWGQDPEGTPGVFPFSRRGLRAGPRWRGFDPGTPPWGTGEAQSRAPAPGTEHWAQAHTEESSGPGDEDAVPTHLYT